MTDNIKPEHYRKGEIDLYEAFSQIFPHNEYRAGMQMIAMRYMFRDKIDRVEDLGKAIYTLERLKEKEIEHTEENTKTIKDAFDDMGKAFGGINFDEWLSKQKNANLLASCENGGEKWKVGKVMKIEIEKPVIPQFVADYLRRAKADITFMRVMELANTRNELPKWKNEYDWISANDETFARAWIHGYEIEQEPLYYAKIKGWEHVGTSSYYFGYDEDNDSLEVTYLNCNYRFAFSLTKKHWNKLGINDTNADFEDIE